MTWRSPGQFDPHYLRRRQLALDRQITPRNPAQIFGTCPARGASLQILPDC
jgi:hypothetical protein